MTKTYIATNKPDKVILVEDGEISYAINPNCNEWADYEAYVSAGNELIEPQPSEAHVFMQGTWVLDAQLQEQLQNEYRKKCEDAITQYIQTEVERYNATNDVIFRDIHSCKAYADVQGYTHQPFCATVWAWNVDVWEAARNILADVKSGTRATPTVDELLGELPVLAA
jgi:quinol monooxygenase YgiN